MIYLLGVLLCWVAPAQRDENTQVRAGIALTWPVSIPLITLLLLLGIFDGPAAGNGGKR